MSEVYDKLLKSRLVRVIAYANTIEHNREGILDKICENDKKQSERMISKISLLRAAIVHGKDEIHQNRYSNLKGFIKEIKNYSDEFLIDFLEYTICKFQLDYVKSDIKKDATNNGKNNKKQAAGENEIIDLLKKNGRDYKSISSFRMREDLILEARRLGQIKNSLSTLKKQSKKGRTSETEKTFKQIEIQLRKIGDEIEKLNIERDVLNSFCHIRADLFLEQTKRLFVSNSRVRNRQRFHNAGMPVCNTHSLKERRHYEQSNDSSQIKSILYGR